MRGVQATRNIDDILADKEMAAVINYCNPSIQPLQSCSICPGSWKASAAGETADRQLPIVM
jgi:hypothetical protein